MAQTETRKKLVVDFDNTLFHTHQFPEVGPQRFLNKLVASFVRRKKRLGWVILLNTMRSPGRGLEEAVEACHRHRIPIDFVNENYPPDENYWGYSRKISGTLNIDDRNIGLIGWCLRHFG